MSFDSVAEFMRPEDLLTLTFGFVNLAPITHDAATAALVARRKRMARVDPSKPAYIVAFFPPQHILEDVFHGRPPTGTINARLSGRTRVAVRVPAAVANAYGTAIPLLPEPLLEALRTFRVVTPSKSKGNPLRHETAIEYPTGLVIVPEAAAKLTHHVDPKRTSYDEIDLCAPLPAANTNMVEIWHSRLTRDGAREDGVSLTAVYNTRPPGLSPLKPHSNATPQQQCDADSHNNGINEPPCVFDDTYRDELVFVTPQAPVLPNQDGAIEAQRFALSALGAGVALSMHRKVTAGHNLTDWTHVTALGRDDSYQFVFAGKLFPFGFPTSLVVTVRRYVDELDKPQGAYLSCTVTLRVDQPTLRFDEVRKDPDIGDEVHAARMASRSVTISPTTTPDLDITPSGGGVVIPDPDCNAVGNIPLALVPKVSVPGRPDIPFTVTFDDFGKNGPAATKPFLWVSDKIVYPAGTAAEKAVVASRLGLIRDKLGSMPNASGAARAADTVVAPGARIAVSGSRARSTGSVTETVDFICVRGGRTSAAAPLFSVDFAFDPAGVVFDGTAIWKRAAAFAELEFAGQRFGFAPPDPSAAARQAGHVLRDAAEHATELLVHSISFDANILTPDALAPVVRPFIAAAAVAIPAVQRLADDPAVGTTIAAIELADAFRKNPQAEIFARLRDALPVDLQNAADVKSGLATLRQNVIGLSRRFGTLSGVANDAANDVKKQIRDLQGKFDQELQGAKNAAVQEVSDIFASVLGGQTAKILGFINLLDVLEHKKIPIAEGPNYVVNTSPDGTVAATYEYTSRLSVSNNAPVVANDRSKLHVLARAQSHVGGSHAVERTLVCELTDFQVHLPPDGPYPLWPLDIVPLRGMLVIDVRRLAFDFSGGTPKIDVGIGSVKLNPKSPLQFISALEKYLNFGSGFRVDLLADAVAAVVELGLPTISLGAFDIKNLGLSIMLKLPFVERIPELSFNIGTRINPFAISLAFLGGGGYFGIAIRLDGGKVQGHLEGGIEVGAFADINLGVLRGSVQVAVGLALTVDNKEMKLSGFLIASGSVDVLGLISASMFVCMDFTYNFANGCISGSAVYHVEVHVLFFSASVSVGVGFHIKTRDIDCNDAGGGAASFRAAGDSRAHALESAPRATMPSRDTWSRYCRAFG
jgi:hypothetical protein